MTRTTPLLWRTLEAVHWDPQALPQLLREKEPILQSYERTLREAATTVLTRLDERESATGPGR